jgi:Phage integrase, N-terminal SAM-like domain
VITADTSGFAPQFPGLGADPNGARHDVTRDVILQRVVETLRCTWRSTKAAYRSNLDRHFVPFFGDYPLSAILPSLVQT